ncbi:MAG: hypothetical protein OEM96_05995, partial [Gemmatimonadota bacterium]|nr:hypothetical protein [Gemmatimonadota bacterium]
MNGRCVVVLLGLIGLSLPTVHPAMAQEADAVAAERPFIDGGRGDRPYLLDLAGRLAIGGYAEGHFRFERQDGITEDLGF